nr:MAG TPA: hypothetical protein [Caudoviricetes sp.]
MPRPFSLIERCIQNLSLSKQVKMTDFFPVLPHFFAV